jgi:glycosyltransferase involved in cell wall biosynthesis
MRGEGASPGLRTVVIVPALNEALNLPRVIERLRAADCGDICVVDDGSTDDTAAVAKQLGATVLRVPFNLGIGGAVQTGYLWAREHGYEAAAQIDADGQHDPAYLRAALEPIAAGSADVVIGSRFREAGGFRSTFIRRMGIRYLGWLLRIRCGAKVTDPTSGFRVAGRAAIELFAKDYPSDYPEPEAIALAVRSGLRIVEISVNMEARLHGKSSIDSWRTIYYLIKVSLAIVLLPSRGRKRAIEMKATV